MEDDWIVVGAKKVEEKPNWCRYGNACVWRNCQNLHERCQFHDRWLASGKKTRPCRSLETDPTSRRCPEDGGCKYDHRDISKLRVYVDTLPVSTEQELMDSFFPRGMDMRAPGVFDKSRMHVFDRAILYRSLTNAGLKFEKLEDSICISFDDVDGEAQYNPYICYRNQVFDARDYVAAWEEYNQEIREQMVW